MRQLTVLRPFGTYRSLNPVTLFTVNNEPFLQLHLAPGLLINKIRDDMLSTVKQAPTDIRNIMTDASEHFLYGTIDDQSPAEYVNSLHRLSGLPVTVIHNSMHGLANFLATVQERMGRGQPKGAISYEQISPDYEGGVWVPYGELLSVIAPGNHPLSNQGWLEALSYGYRIMLRPSQSDPLTAYRLIRALQIAGLAEGMAAYVPCEHTQVDNVVTAGDLSLVYGGPSVVERYQHNSKVILRGPGYSKILLDSDIFCLSKNMQKQLVDSILVDGGVKCTNVSGLLVQGRIDPVLLIIKEYLSCSRAAPLFNEHSVLPVMPLNIARHYASYLEDVCEKESITLIPCTGDAFLVDLGDGTACLEPVILLANHTPKELDDLNLELPFPCVWITKWPENKSLTDLSSTLALGLYTDNLNRLNEALANTNIKKVIMTGHEVSSNLDIPHDGFLANHLLTVKGFKGTPISTYEKR